MKKALSFILAVVMMISCFVGMTITAAAEYYQGPMPGAHTTPLNISGKTYGYRAVINQEFNEIGFYMPTWGVTTGTYCSIAIYEWDTSYEKTLEGTPLYDQKFEPMNNSRLRIKFNDNPLPAGEYLFYIYDTCEANCGLYIYRKNGVVDTKGVSYLDGVANRSIMPDLNIYTPDPITGSLFGECDVDTEYSENIAAKASVGATYNGGYAVSYTNNSTMSIHTYINYDFTAFEFGITSASKYCTYSLYKWDTSIEQTLASEPVVSQKVEDKGLGYKLTFDEPMPAGDYLFRLSGPSSGLSLDFYSKTNNEANLDGVYYHGSNVRADGVPVFFVYTADENYVEGTMFSKEPPAAAPETTAPETTAPAPEETTAPETTAPAPEETTAPETTAPEPEVPAVPEYSESITDNVGGTYHGNYVVNYADKGRMIYQTYVNYDFIAFDFGVYTNSTDPQPYTYSLYKWDTSIENTLAGEPVASQRFEDLVKGAATARLEFDEPMPEGEYVFMVSNASGSVCVPFYTGVQNLNGTYYHKANLGVRDDAMPGLTVYTTDESYVEGTMFSKEPPAPAETYIYENSLDGNQYTYQGHEALDVNNLSDDVRAKFDLYANGAYNKLIDFEHVSSIEGVHTYRSVHNTDATVTVNGETATPDAGGVYYLLEADETDGEGVPFYGWYDENAGIYLSYSAIYKFFPDSASENITAVYKVAEKEIVANVTATRTENKLAVTVTPNYPSDVTNVKYGYYISTDAAALDVNNITASGDSTVAPHVYMVRVYDIQATTQEKNIYLLGWISYGEEARIYTSLITVAPDGTVTVAEA